MPAQVSEFFSQRVALGNATYVVTFRYNARMDRWLIDVADANTVPLVTGLPILGGWPMIQRFQGIVKGLPEGFWVALDMTGAGRDPQQETLGGDIPLFYSKI
jgi:hypothetical protein